jgi:hypothetical protein
VRLSWTPPGDDWLCGTPARWDITRASGEVVASGTSGSSASLPASLKRESFTIRYVDEAGNWGLPASFGAVR